MSKNQFYLKHNLLNGTPSTLVSYNKTTIGLHTTNAFDLFTLRQLSKVIAVSTLICLGSGCAAAMSAHAAAPSSLIEPRMPDLLPIATITSDADVSCDESCDDIDAVVDEDAFSSEEPIDTDILEDDRSNDDQELDDQKLDKQKSETQRDQLKVSQLKLTPDAVPLNAISPKTIATFVEVIDIIRHDYFKPVNDEALFQQAIRGMLEKLDPHAEYLTPAKFEKLRSFTDGEIGQVGLSAKFDTLNKVWVIDKVLPRSSAKESGLKIGQKLLRIKEVKLTEDMRSQDIEQLLAGIAGSQVPVTVVDDQGIKRDIVLQRNLSQINKLTVDIKNGIAIVKLPIFQNSSRTQLIDALREKGVPITGVIIDVRNNPGGVLSSAIDIASLFVADKNLIQVRNRANNNQVISARGTPFLSDLPIVILQNKYTASAAEVLSSSLQTNKLAKIIGERSFGKGTVQEVVPLKSGGGLKLTVAEYRSATGGIIDGFGVQPDITLVSNGQDWIDQAISIILSSERPIGIKFDDNKGPISIANDY